MHPIDSISDLVANFLGPLLVNALIVAVWLVPMKIIPWFRKKTNITYVGAIFFALIPVMVSSLTGMLGIDSWPKPMELLACAICVTLLIWDWKRTQAKPGQNDAVVAEKGSNVPHMDSILTRFMRWSENKNVGTKKLIEKGLNTGSNMRRIIAREGLIIISLMLFAWTSFFLDLWVKKQIELYESTAITIATPYTLSLLDELFPRIDSNPFGRNRLGRDSIALQFSCDTSDKTIQRVLTRDYPNDPPDTWTLLDNPRHSEIKAYYDKRGERVFDSIFYRTNFFYAYIFFLCLYPLYLLTRFVFWALITLKGKS